MPSSSTLERVKTVIRNSLKLDEHIEIADGMALAGGEYDLDSLDILLIVTNLEKEFGIKINDATMAKSAFQNVQTLTAFVNANAATPDPALSATPPAP